SDLARRSPYPDRHPGPRLAGTRQSHMPAPETQKALSFEPVPDDTVASRLAKSDRLKPLWAPSQPRAAAPAPPATAKPPAGREAEEAAWSRQHLLEAESARRSAGTARSSARPDPGTRLADAGQIEDVPRIRQHAVEAKPASRSAEAATSSSPPDPSPGSRP